jgi:hypothetical protein
VGANAVIGPGVQIGVNSRIGANANVRCALIGAFAGVVQECREGSCVVVSGLGEPCSTEPDCASETLGLTCASNVCRKIEGFPCSASTDCASGLCAPVVRDRCVDAAAAARGHGWIGNATTSVRMALGVCAGCGRDWFRA